MTSLIANAEALEILDSRGWPTLSVTVRLLDGTRASASVPAGASKGRYEAVEKRDGDRARYGGRGVQHAIDSVALTVAPALQHRDPTQQAAIDATLAELDGTPDKSRLGANTILAVSLAVARAGAAGTGLPLYQYLGGPGAVVLPVPLMNVINGGKHADTSLLFQEFMVVPHGAGTFAEAVRWGAETYHALARLLHEKGHRTAVGDEGGFAPDLPSAHAACELLVEAIARTGRRPGPDVAIALDPAATSFHTADGYRQLASGPARLDSDGMIRAYAGLIEAFPIVSIEDGLAEDDAAGAVAMTRALGHRVQLVGDDMYVTDPARIRRGIADGSANAALIKPNQVGTLTETLAALHAAQAGGWATVLSHRSGETDDSFIADLAVAAGCGQIKAGAPCRGERVAKYNRLLAIEQELGPAAVFRSPFRQRWPA